MGLLNALIEQAKNPRGFVGNIMIKIMNQAHTSITTWGLRKIEIKSGDPILDIGCGGGQTIHTLAKQNKQHEIYGIDYSEQAVETSIQKNNKAVIAGKVKISQEMCQRYRSTMDFLGRSQRFRHIISGRTSNTI